MAKEAKWEWAGGESDLEDLRVFQRQKQRQGFLTKIVSEEGVHNLLIKKKPTVSKKGIKPQFIPGPKTRARLEEMRASRRPGKPGRFYSEMDAGQQREFLAKRLAFDTSPHADFDRRVKFLAKRVGKPVSEVREELYRDAEMIAAGSGSTPAFTISKQRPQITSRRPKLRR